MSPTAGSVTDHRRGTAADHRSGDDVGYRSVAVRLLTGLALVAPLGGSASAATSGCVTGPAGVPGRAYAVAEYARGHSGAARPGYVGNTVFQNREGHLEHDLGRSGSTTSTLR